MTFSGTSLFDCTGLTRPRIHFLNLHWFVGVFVFWGCTVTARSYGFATSYVEQAKVSLFSYDTTRSEISPVWRIVICMYIYILGSTWSINPVRFFLCYVVLSYKDSINVYCGKNSIRMTEISVSYVAENQWETSCTGASKVRYVMAPLCLVLQWTR